MILIDLAPSEGVGLKKHFKTSGSGQSTPLIRGLYRSPQTSRDLQGPKMRDSHATKVASERRSFYDEDRQNSFPLRNSLRCPSLQRKIASEWRYAILVHSGQTPICLCFLPVLPRQQRNSPQEPLQNIEREQRKIGKLKS